MNGGEQSCYKAHLWPMRSRSEELGCHLTKINSDISTSLYTSSDVKHVPQFTDARQIEDNMGALGANQNKDQRASQGRLEGASRSLMQLTTFTWINTSLTRARTSFQF